MENLAGGNGPFVFLLALSVILLLLHICIQAMSVTREVGLAWNAGARDARPDLKGVFAGRVQRASDNFRETYPAFVGLVLALAIVGDASGWGLTGGWIWTVARVVYIPLYLAGVPYMRSIAWVVSLVGLVLMLVALI
ncbi:MAPEG family protein [Agrobacterium tumefaciens]|uniref:MAPEG family protein n=1 Tax=Agrobacterium tumefaciens complex TaxID=1183400 RepID=UPI00101A815D|nr:MAPEG family protein [Agrobacterium tumefaciens]WHO20897.1 MAPEG family protein [Agrobacterium tumefaciens]